jgi:DNA replication licensing factor MCM4
LDKVDEGRDRQLAKHIVSLYTNREEVDTVIPVSRLTDYIAYAKEKCHPQFTQAAQDILVDGYVKMRDLSGRNVVSATPRQLESCIRLAEANAKMRLSPFVEEMDADEALNLVKEALHQSATDPQTGVIDMDLLTTGTSAVHRARISLIGREITRMLQNTHNKVLAVTQIVGTLRTVVGANTTEIEVYDALRSLESEDVVFLTVESGRPIKASLLHEGVR